MSTTRQLPSNKKAAKKRAGKRKTGGVIFSIVLILFFLAAAFWFGWIQFQIEEGEFAVVYTKSHGYEERPVPHGEFAWRWEALLPTNLSMHRFRVNTRSLSIDESGSLPSADYYASIVGGDVDFSWRVRGSLVYGINPDILPSMVEKNGPDIQLESYYDNFESQVIGAIQNTVAEQIDVSFESSSFSTRINAFRELLLDNIRESMSGNTPPPIIILSLSITSLRLPDPPLYTQAREAANIILENRRETILELQALSLQERDNSNSRLDLLREYGDVITKYPALIDLFALEGNPASSLLPPTAESQ